MLGKPVFYWVAVPMFACRLQTLTFTPRKSTPEDKWAQGSLAVLPVGVSYVASLTQSRVNWEGSLDLERACLGQVGCRACLWEIVLITSIG